MEIMTLKARETITSAIDQYGDNTQRRIWRSWAATHTEVRRGPADPEDDGTGPMDSKVASAIHSALTQMHNAMTQRYNEPGISEDAVSDLDHHRTYLRGLAKRYQPATAAP